MVRNWGNQCRRHLGQWSLAQLGFARDWYVYFEGGFGNCTSLDSVHVTIHPAPIHERLDYLSACGGATLDFSFNATGMGGVCWSFNWYDQELPACSDSTTWEVDGTGFVEWVATDSLGCQSGMVFELVDLGGPNAPAGGDTTLCLGSTPNIMEFEFGEPLALGCNPASGVWSGEGASHEYFAEVWSEGNCIQPEEPWIDSVWVFNASDLGDFEWIWTVVDCNGCGRSRHHHGVCGGADAAVHSLLGFLLGRPCRSCEPQAGACWSGAGIDPNFVFNPVVAGLGEHVWTVGYEKEAVRCKTP